MQDADLLKSGHDPLEHSDLQTLFAPLRRINKLLVAVSGGADSLALMLLCHEWIVREKISLQLHAASVDHGLRSEATKECDQVARIAHNHGISHTILSWTGDKPVANLQSSARDARYRLLQDHARSIGANHIAVAHHADDQAETLLMRLIRGSGVTGLGAMRAEKSLEAVTLLRPFLGIPKARLVASLETRGVEWVEDPSNRNADFLRVRVRSLLPLLAEEGCDAARLCATARRLQRAEFALNQTLDRFMAEHVRSGPGQSLCAPLFSYLELAEEFRLRLLRRALLRVVAATYPPREEQLLALDAFLCGLSNNNLTARRTMGGCCFHVSNEHLWIYRERGRDPLTLAIASSDPVDWLGLYDISVSYLCEAQVTAPELRALGEDGVAMLEKEDIFFPTHAWGLELIPRSVLAALPSVWWQGSPISVVDWFESPTDACFKVQVRKKVRNRTKEKPSEAIL